MLSALRATGLAAGLALAPLAASAATLSPANNITDGGSFDIFDGPYFFDVSFDKNDAAGSYSFTFTNTTAAAQALAVSIGTVLQSTLNFVGGVTISWASGESAFIPDNKPADVFNISTLIDVGASDTLMLTFGNPDGTADGRANIDLTVDATPKPAPIPVPASALLLIGALGGLASLRRRVAG